MLLKTIISSEKADSIPSCSACFRLLQSAIFDFSSLVTAILLLIVTCTYLRGFRKTIFDNAPSPDGVIRHEGIMGLCWKFSRIGERKSEWVSLTCLIMAVHLLFIKK